MDYCQIYEIKTTVKFQKNIEKIILHKLLVATEHDI
jgi:hypothetical protein